MIITGHEHKILKNLDDWLEKRRIKYQNYFNLHQDDMYHQAKMGELINILDKIDELKKRCM